MKIVALLLFAWAFAGASQALALPSFAVQSSQPCSACHVGSFGGRLKELGRDFKLNGYATSDNNDHYIPFNVSIRSSFTHTDADIVGGASDGFDVNDNAAFDGVSIAYGGKIFDNVGGVARVNYNGIRQTWAWGGFDLRYAEEVTMLGADAIVGTYVNNGPSRSDIFENLNSGVPTTSSGLSRRPRGGFVVNSLGGLVAGLGAYTMIDERFYVELAAYDGLNRDTLNTLGVDPLNGSDEIKGIIPYGRAAYVQNFGDDHHTFAFGTSMTSTDVYPKGNESAGHNRFTEVGADLHYAHTFDPAKSTSDYFAARVAIMHQQASLDASHALSGTKEENEFTALKADATYSMDATVTTMVQYFSNNGTKDVKRWSGNGNVDSRGWIAQVDYSPWGKPDSPVDWFNLRVSASYTAYEEFNGDTLKASDRNTFFVGLALHGTTAQ
jgi:hypothetical protein